MKQSDLYYFESTKMMSQAQSKLTENTRLRLVFSIQNLTRLVTSFLWLQNSIDRQFHRISVNYRKDLRAKDLLKIFFSNPQFF